MRAITTILLLILSSSILSIAESGPNKEDSLHHLLIKASSSTDSSKIYSSLSELYFQNEQYDEAIEVNYTLLGIARRLNDPSLTGDAYNGLGRIYYNREDFDLAINYYSQALTHFKAVSALKKVGVVLNNIALVYYEIDSLDAALDYYFQALSNVQENNNPLVLASINHNIALIYNQQDEPAKAITYLKESLDIFRRLNNERFIANTLNNIGRAYYKMNNQDLALIYFDSAYSVAKEIGAAYLIMDNLRYKADSYIEKADYINAFMYMKMHYHAKDSIFDIEKENQLAEIRTRFESELKEQENVLLKKENEINEAIIRHQHIVGVAIISVVVLLTVVTILLYYFYQQKRKANELLSKQKKEIETQNSKLEKLNLELNLKKSELESLNQIKDKLFSIISHEFRSPLNSLKGTLSLVMADAINLDELKKLSTDITSNINNTSIFLDNLLNWAKSQMQGIHAHPESCALKEIIESNINLLQPQADKKEIAIVVTCDPNINVLADREMINLVVRNLISNAIKFTRIKGKIEISATPDQGKVTVSVKDSGVGIPKENLSKLFRLDTSTTKGTANEKGTGIGLMLSKNFVEMNGGDIRAESEEGKGATISFTLPTNG